MRAHLRALLGACTFLSTPALAQDSAPRPESWLPEIVVTAERPGYAASSAGVTRTDLPLVRTPQSVQVLTGTLIREQDASTLADVLRNVPGAVAALPSEAVLANPILRGFEAEIFVDGLAGYGDTAVIDPSSLWAYERVEVAKGPASLLFGGGIGAPLGGLINLVSKTPAAESHLRAEVRAGSFGLFQPRIDLNYAESADFGLRLTTEYTAGGDPVLSTEPQRIAVNPSLRVGIGPKTDLVARLGYSKVKQREYAGLPAQIIDEVRPRFRFSGATDAPRTEIENLIIDGVLTHRFSEQVKAVVQLRRYESDFDEVASFPFFAFYPLDGTAAPIITGRLPVGIKEWTVDASLAAEFETGPVRHQLLAGVLRDMTDYRGAIGFNFLPVGILDYADPESDVSFGDIPATSDVWNDYRTTALYVQDSASWGRLTVQGGVRFNRYGLNELVGGSGLDTHYTEWDPRIGGAYELLDGVSVFAGWAKGSRLTIFFSGAEPPVPERSKSLEAGLKLGAKELGLSGTIALFRINRENVPTPDPDSPFVSVQTGEQRSRGVEVDLVWEPSPSLSVLATYAYTDATVTEDTAIPVGARLPRVPEHSGRFAARYRVVSGPLAGFGIGAGVSAASAAEVTLPNSFTGDSYAILDTQLSYERGPWRLGVSVQNLTDRRYFIPYQYLGQAVVRPGDPRSAFVTLGIGF